ncbi:uncharacterized protein LOC114928097 [Nylanderia fulva]|uniref:uncharacterized protein LOC114928097 n=1 Tax=Nylanderia fulva TaxID=613905 RepID=UPI0010FB44A1|nr:uncharacterized protein LOC114928097 [Nylanderia fulva]
MKTLVIIACLLTISYAADPEKLKAFYNNYQTCLDTLSAPEWTAPVMKCMLQNMELIDDEGIIKKDELLTGFEKIISDEGNLNQAKTLVSSCYEQGYEGDGSNDEKTMMIIQCAINVKDLFDKP